MNILTRENAIDTQAVVIMYGWFGASSKHLKKYVDLYVNHPRYKCAVVYGISRKAATITRSDKKLNAQVMDAVRKAVGTIQTIESARNANGNTTEVPIVLHYFSNGGAFVAEKFSLLVKNAISGNMKNSQDAEDLKFVHKRLAVGGYEIIDSAPAYLHDDLARRVVGQSIPNPLLKTMLQGLVCITIAMLKTSSCICGKRGTEEQFWNNMLESTLCQRQAFVYSSCDKFTDPEKLDEFIVARKKRGVEVMTLKFEDSEHVMHLYRHPKEYKEKLVDHVLKTVLVKGSETPLVQ